MLAGVEAVITIASTLFCVSMFMSLGNLVYGTLQIVSDDADWRDKWLFLTGIISILMFTFWILAMMMR